MRHGFAFLVSATALIATTYGLTRFGYGLFVPAFAGTFSLTPTLTGGISSGSFAAYCVAAAMAYRLAAAPRATVVLAGATAAGGSAGVALSTSPLMLALCMVIAGAGAGFASPGLVTLVEEKIRTAQARAQALVNAGTGFGVVLAGPLALLLMGQWRTAWWIIAAFNIAATAAVLLTTPRRAGTRARTGSFAFRQFLRLRAATVAAFLAGSASAAVWTFGRSVVSTEGRMAELGATVFWTLLGAAGIAGAFSGDLVIRWGLRRAWISTAAVMGAATVTLGVLPSSAFAVYAGGALFGASYVALSGVLIAWATEALPARAAEGTAALFIVLALGQAAGAILVGSLMDAAGPAVAFVVAAAVAGASAIPALKRAPDSALSGAGAR